MNGGRYILHYQLPHPSFATQPLHKLAPAACSTLHGITQARRLTYPFYNKNSHKRNQTDNTPLISRYHPPCPAPTYEKTMMTGHTTSRKKTPMQKSAYFLSRLHCLLNPKSLNPRPRSLLIYELRSTSQQPRHTDANTLRPPIQRGTILHQHLRTRSPLPHNTFSTTNTPH